jgi:hypothetical protein
MVTPLELLALGLLILGVVGSVLPLVPGALSSLAGILLYWWSTGFADPGPLVLGGFLLVGLATLVVDWAGGAIAARAGGASALTTALSVIAGVLLALLTGPAGLLLGIAGTVFLVEYVRERDAPASARTAGYATVGVLASNAVQVLLTGGMLVGFLFVLFL